jgi:hypothetical protein
MQLTAEGIEKPIAYASTSLSKAEQNYGITHKEGLGIIYAVRKWRNYLQSNVVIIITDHSSCVSLVNPTKEFDNRRMARYAMELSEFDIVIAHRPGEQLLAPDLLSRLQTDLPADKVEELLDRAVGQEAQLAMNVRQHMRESIIGKEAQQRRLSRRVSGAEIREQAGGDTRAKTIIGLVKLIAEGSRTPQQRQIGEDESPNKVDEFYDMVCTTTVEVQRNQHNCCALTRGSKAKTQEATDMPQLVEDDSSDSDSDDTDSDDSDSDDSRDTKDSGYDSPQEAEVQLKRAQDKKKVARREAREQAREKAESDRAKLDTAALTETDQIAPVTLQRIMQAQMQDTFTLNMIKHLQTEGTWLPESDDQARQCIMWATRLVINQGMLCSIKARRPPMARDDGTPLLAPLLQIFVPNDKQLQIDIVRAVHLELVHTQDI